MDRPSSSGNVAVANWAGVYIYIYISLHFLRLHKALRRYVERYTSGSPFRQGLGLIAYDSDQAVGDRKLADIL